MTTTCQPVGRTPRGRQSRRDRSYRALTLEPLEERITPSDFTMTSPTSRGTLPTGVSAVGGIVLDLVGANGRRVVSQLPAGVLFRGQYDDGTPAAFEGNPGTIGIQTGFTAELLDALGGGLSEVAVRLTLFDGDTAAGDFDSADNVLLLNGVNLGEFSAVPTQTTNEQGQDVSGGVLGAGFADERLDTGFFYSSDPATLSGLFTSLAQTGQVAYQLLDDDPFENFFDFTLGLDGELIDVGSPPVVVLLPPQLTLIETTGPTDEGSPVTILVTATDPDGTGQPLTFDFDFDGDGVFEASNVVGEASHAFADEGSYQVVVRVRDADGQETSATIVAEVNNVPPSLADVSLQLGANGAPATLSFDARDPGSDDLILIINWGDGQTTSHAGAGVVRLSANLPPGSYQMTLTLFDGDGGEDVVTLLISVPFEPPPVTPADVPNPVLEPVVASIPPQPIEPLTTGAESQAVLLNALLVAMREDVRGDATQPTSSPTSSDAANFVSGSLLASNQKMPLSGGGGNDGEVTLDGPSGEMPPTRRSEPPPIPTPDAPADATPSLPGAFADVANAIRQALVELQERLTKRASEPRPGNEPVPVVTARAQPDAKRPAGAVQTVLLLMAAILIHRAWATSAASAVRLARRRRRGRRPPATAPAPPREPPSG